MLADGTVKKRCIYSAHSLRATLLLSAGVDIRKVQELLRHRHLPTMQIYDEQRFGKWKVPLMGCPFRNHLVGMPPCLSRVLRDARSGCPGCCDVSFISRCYFPYSSSPHPLRIGTSPKW